VVERVTADGITIKYERLFDASGIVEYKLKKFRRATRTPATTRSPWSSRARRSGAATCWPTAQHRERRAGPGPQPAGGLHALGRLQLRGRHPGLRALVKDDVFTSMHIEEFELAGPRHQARRRGDHPRDPQRGRGGAANLDETGVIYIGAEVKAGDILVGKVTPKGETELTPEEKLLRAIFGEKAGDVKDASLKAPPGMDGVVVGINVFSRQDKVDRSKKDEKRKLDALRRDRDRKRELVEYLRSERLGELFDGQIAHHVIDANTGEVLVKAGRKFTAKVLEELDLAAVHWGLPLVKDAKVDQRLRDVFDSAYRELDRIDVEYEKQCERVQRGDELPPGVVKLVKVYVARKRKLNGGRQDGRPPRQQGRRLEDHAEEDMPYLADGTPVDIVLNPLGVPSRMNLGPDPRDPPRLGRQPPGPARADPGLRRRHDRGDQERPGEAGLPRSGKTPLIDGRNGETFDKEVTVGTIYMLKLHHLVDEKIHARSDRPVLPRHPAAAGRQGAVRRPALRRDGSVGARGLRRRALPAGDADGQVGRRDRPLAVYEAIVKGENPPEPGIPESFNVLMKELQSLCLDVTPRS
jgi:DNA-directed RNA polymerase subunit beta